MKPVWAAFPSIPWGSAGWRMGHGEPYMLEWCQWFMNHDPVGRVAYRAQWPEPDPWAGFYDFVEFRRPPLWMSERHRKLDEPQLPPAPDELEITDYFRIAWLMRRHLQRLVYPEVPRAQQELRPDEFSVAFYAEPSGAKWRISDLSAGGYLMRRVPHEV